MANIKNNTSQKTPLRSRSQLATQGVAIKGQASKVGSGSPLADGFVRALPNSLDQLMGRPGQNPKPPGGGSTNPGLPGMGATSLSFEGTLPSLGNDFTPSSLGSNLPGIGTNHLAGQPGGSPKGKSSGLAPNVSDFGPKGNSVPGSNVLSVGKKDDDIPPPPLGDFLPPPPNANGSTKPKRNAGDHLPPPEVKTETPKERKAREAAEDKEADAKAAKRMEEAEVQDSRTAQQKKEDDERAAKEAKKNGAQRPVEPGGSAVPETVIIAPGGSDPLIRLFGEDQDQGRHGIEHFAFNPVADPSPNYASTGGETVDIKMVDGGEVDPGQGDD